MASPTTSAAAWPSGYRAPLAVITNDDHRGWIIICNALGIVIILLTLLIRLYIRTKVSPPFGPDDHTLFAATALALIQPAVALSQAHRGFGSSLHLITDNNLVAVEKLGWVADVFYVWALYLSKLSVVLLFKRIASGVAQKSISWVALSLTITFGVITTFLIALRCNVSQPWFVIHENCSSLPAQWDTITALDIVTEVGLFAMSIQLVWGLQTKLSRKGRVVFAFGLRLPTVLVAAFHIAYLHSQLSSSNPTLAGTIPSMLRQTEMFYAIMASTIPCLRPFLAGFATNYGAMGSDTVMHGSQIGHSSRDKGTYGKNSTNSSNEMTSSRFRSKGKGKALRIPGTEDFVSHPGTLRPDHARHRASISHETQRGSVGADASSVASDESTKMIIKKEVQWRVTGEGRTGNALDQVGV